MISKNWIIRTPHPHLQAQMSSALNIHPLVAQVLINRDVRSVQDASSFLRGDLFSLHDPFLLKDMDKAVARIQKAHNEDERVLIYGDYDVDGITSSVLLRKTFSKMGMDADHYIPHRLNEGYGLNHSVVVYCQENKIDLLVAVDCGIRAVGEVDALERIGVDVIIVDHHEPFLNQLPKAVAVIDPKRHDCSYPFKELAAVGLVYKLSQALLKGMPKDFLDLVALGTIADVAQLRGENHIFVKEGLERLNQTDNMGLQALMDVSRIKGKKVTPHSVGFILGPRLNASGRISSAKKSLDLLLSEDRHEAMILARRLEEINHMRQKTQNTIIQEALGLVERDVNFKEQKIIVVSQEGWHRGVLGIVASRIAETYYRPAIVISCEEGMGSGSARSIETFHLFEALGRCSDLLENFGGHRFAAGLTIREERIEDFRKTINIYAQDMIKPEDLIPTLEVDADVRLSSLTLRMVQELDDISPFGEGNPYPLFCSKGLKVKSVPAVLSRDTLKFWVTDGRVTISAVGFGMGRFKDLVAQAREVDLAFSLLVDDWNKEPTVQLKLKDIKFH